MKAGLATAWSSLVAALRASEKEKEIATEEERERLDDLADTALSSPDAGRRTAALKELLKTFGEAGGIEGADRTVSSIKNPGEWGKKAWSEAVKRQGDRKNPKRLILRHPRALHALEKRMPLAVAAPFALKLSMRLMSDPDLAVDKTDVETLQRMLALTDFSLSFDGARKLGLDLSSEGLSWLRIHAFEQLLEIQGPEALQRHLTQFNTLYNRINQLIQLRLLKRESFDPVPPADEVGSAIAARFKKGGFGSRKQISEYLKQHFTEEFGSAAIAARICCSDSACRRSKHAASVSVP